MVYVNFEQIDKLFVGEKNPLCIECGKVRVSQHNLFPHERVKRSRRESNRAGLCNVCRRFAKERPASQTLAMSSQKGGVKREQRFKPLRHIGITLRGKKFADWANEYIKENNIW